jgi:protease-4
MLCLCVPAPAADEKPAEKAAANTSTEKSVIAVFRLHGPVTEAPMDEMLSLFGDTGGTSLRDLVSRLDKAREDKTVKAVVLTVDGFGVGFAQMEELRQAIDAIKSSGKDVYVHADSLYMREYALVSGASRISQSPTATMWLLGLYGEAPYARGLFDKIGVTPDFLTCGDYKSAAEMFMRTGPSKQAEEMQNWLQDSMYTTMVQLVAEGRKVPVDKVKGWIDGGMCSSAAAKEAGMIDAVEHRQEFEAMLRGKFGEKTTFDKRYGKKEGPKIDFSSPFGVLNFYAELLGGARKKAPGKDAVAIVYVEGPIVEGTVEASPLALGGGVAASTPIRRALDKAAADDTIKAVVLRVNSGGGSATASEIIMDATKRVKAKKPLVVSMGDVAGSGGYYVACAADTIFVDRSTITGSIGVVGGKLVTTDAWKNAGITWKGYKRGAKSGIMGSAEPFSDEERKHLQGWMDEIYGVFKGHVTSIRGSKLKKPLDEISGGRVYTGEQALALGLVDKIGTLQDAVRFAAGEAKIEKYETRVVPEPKNFMEVLMEGMSGDTDKEEAQRLTLPRPAGANGGAATLLDVAMPYVRSVDPHRAAAVGRMLIQLETLNRDGVAVIMPEITFSSR